MQGLKIRRKIPVKERTLGRASAGLKLAGEKPKRGGYRRWKMGKSAGQPAEGQKLREKILL